MRGAQGRRCWRKCHNCLDRLHLEIYGPGANTGLISSAFFIGLRGAASLCLALKSGPRVALVVGVNCFLPKFCSAFGAYLICYLDGSRHHWVRHIGSGGRQTICRDDRNRCVRHHLVLQKWDQGHG
eukprot:symbB.v1.2.034863.t1/scaffold4577.1/size37779/4